MFYVIYYSYFITYLLQKNAPRRAIYRHRRTRRFGKNICFKSTLFDAWHCSQRTYKIYFWAERCLVCGAVHTRHFDQKNNQFRPTRLAACLRYESNWPLPQYHKTLVDSTLRQYCTVRQVLFIVVGVSKYRRFFVRRRNGPQSICLETRHYFLHQCR